jgi:VPS62-like protein
MATLTDQELLDAHAPLLRYDPQDLLRVIAAESMVSNPGNVLLDADGETIGRAAPVTTAAPGGSAPALTFALLADHASRSRAREEQIAQAPGYAGDARRMQQATHVCARRIHGRVRRYDDGSAWLQYWLFYYYNPKNLRGFGKHEGDWEMVQVRLDAAGRPDAVTYAQHSHGEARSWNEIQHDGEHPIVYVGQLSHASYFERGSYPYPVFRAYLPFGIDHALGGRSGVQPAGPEVIPAVDMLPEQGWPLWPGTWGSCERAVSIFIARIGDGPPGPGHQGQKWSDPPAFHKAQTKLLRWIRRGVGALSHFVGNLSFPRPPELHSAELVGNDVVVDYTAHSRGLRRTRYVLLTVNQADGDQLVLASRTIRPADPPAGGRFTLQAPSGAMRVWASAFNGPRQRSELASMPVSYLEPRVP